MVQVMPWILDVGYTVLLVALLVAFMGHLLFGDFEYTMNTFPASISGLLWFVFTRTKLNRTGYPFMGCTSVTLANVLYIKLTPM